MTSEKFFKLFLLNHSTIDCNGIELKWTGKFYNYERFSGSLEVPIYEIINPKDKPYTKEALSMVLEDRYKSILKIIPYQPTIPRHLLAHIEGDDFNIPMDILNHIKKCMRNLKVDLILKVSTTDDETIKLVGHFDGEFYFEFHNDEIHFYPDLVDVSIYKNDEVITDEEEFDGWSDYVRFDNPSLLEDFYWDCLTPLVTDENFVNYDWMSIYTTPRFYIAK